MNKIRIAGFGIALASWLAGVAGAHGAVFVKGDYNADGLYDLAMYDNASGIWTIRNVPGDIIASNVDWGGAGLQPVCGDYDGDGIWDLALYHAASGGWYIRTLAGTILLRNEIWGGPDMIPVPGDYNGDGIWDLAVFQPSTGLWYARTITGNILILGETWGGPGFEAVSGDYDGDRQSDAAVYSESTGTWRIFGSAMGLTWEGVWGGPGMKPVSGDFDGDRVSDLAVRNSASGLWKVYSLAKSAILAQDQACGTAGYAADAADFDGDMKADPLTYDAEKIIWMINLSRSGYAMATLRGNGGTVAGNAVHMVNVATNMLGRCMALTYVPSTVSFSQTGITAFAGDFTGDAIDELCVYQQKTGRWYIRENLNGDITKMELGGPGFEAVAGDYDGDRITDPAVFERASGLWMITKSSSYGIVGIWGNSNSILVPADYDGDGMTDPAVYQPETGYWHAFLSGTSAAADLYWGFEGVLPAVADFDGDGRADPAVFWPEEGRWYIFKSGGGIVNGQVLGWRGCIPIPADYDGDGLADLAVYWPAGGQSLIKSSSHFYTRIKFWNRVPSMIDTARCQAIAARFSAGAGRRICILDQITGQMLTEPSEPQIPSGLGASLHPMQGLTDLLRHDSTPSLRSKGSKGLADIIVSLVIGIGGSILETYHANNCEAEIKQQSEKLDAISASLTEIMNAQNNLLVQLNMTRKELEAEIWQATMSAAITEISNTHMELLKFNPKSYATLSQAARTIKVAEYEEDYGKRDIKGRMSDLHTYITGLGRNIPSSLVLWKDLLIDQIKSGQDAALCYHSFEEYFTELLSYQVEGLQVYGHHVLYTNGVPGQEVFADYITGTFVPRIAQQTELFLTCVDELVVASVTLGTEATPRLAWWNMKLPESVVNTYNAADFLAASVSTGHAWGLSTRIIGEPDNVQAYADGNQYGYRPAQSDSGLALPVAAVQRFGNLKEGSYLAWNWWTDGAFSGYNKFKTETQLAVSHGTVANLALGDYVVYAPWGNDAQGRQVNANVRNYDSHMNPLAADATNGHRFGSAVLFVRSQPSLKEGEKTQTKNHLMGADCFAFTKEIDLGSRPTIRLITKTIKDTPSFWGAPYADDQASIILPIYNGNTHATNMTFDIEVAEQMMCSERGTGYNTVAKLEVQCGDWWSSDERRIPSTPTVTYFSGQWTDSRHFTSPSIPVGSTFNLIFRAFQESLWFGGITTYRSGAYNEDELYLDSIQIH